MNTLGLSSAQTRDRFIEPIADKSANRIQALDPIDRAFEEAYVRHRTDVLTYVLAFVANPAEAEDVTSDVFERALRSWRRSGALPSAILPWLLLTARRLATDRWRRASRAVSRRIGMPGTGPPQEELVESLVWFDSLGRILPPRQREAIVLRYQADLSDAAIGSVMGLTQSGVRSLIARAIATLRDHPEAWE